MLTVKFVSLREANRFVETYHRHHGVVIGHKYSLGAYVADKLVGVVIVGRPVSRHLDDGKTLEITRLCTDGTRNACSFLYGAAARQAKKRGYEKIITYILQSENGASLKASGFVCDKEKAGKPSWNTERYANKPEQLSLFPRREPPKEYKKRFVKQLINKKGADIK